MGISFIILITTLFIFIGFASIATPQGKQDIEYQFNNWKQRYKDTTYSLGSKFSIKKLNANIWGFAIFELIFLIICASLINAIIAHISLAPMKEIADVLPLSSENVQSITAVIVMLGLYTVAMIIAIYRISQDFVRRISMITRLSEIQKKETSQNSKTVKQSVENK